MKKINLAFCVLSLMSNFAGATSYDGVGYLPEERGHDEIVSRMQEMTNHDNDSEHFFTHGNTNNPDDLTTPVSARTPLRPLPFMISGTLFPKRLKVTKYGGDPYYEDYMYAKALVPIQNVNGIPRTITVQLKTDIKYHRGFNKDFKDAGVRVYVSTKPFSQGKWLKHDSDPYAYDSAESDAIPLDDNGVPLVMRMNKVRYDTLRSLIEYPNYYDEFNYDLAKNGWKHGGNLTDYPDFIPLAFKGSNQPNVYTMTGDLQRLWHSMALESKDFYDSYLSKDPFPTEDGEQVGAIDSYHSKFIVVWFYIMPKYYISTESIDGSIKYLPKMEKHSQQIQDYCMHLKYGTPYKLASEYKQTGTTLNAGQTNNPAIWDETKLKPHVCESLRKEIYPLSYTIFVS